MFYLATNQRRTGRVKSAVHTGTEQSLCNNEKGNCFEHSEPAVEIKTKQSNYLDK